MSTVYTVNGKVLKNAANDKWLAKKEGPEPLPPIPSNTIRVRTSDGNVPINSDSSYETATLVSGTTDVYDVYKSGTNFSWLLAISTNVIEVLGANITGITDVNGMFYGCSSLTTVTLFDTSSVTNINGMFSSCTNLTSVPLFNTSNVTNMGSMFRYCDSLTSVPLFNTSNVTDISYMFEDCYNVQTGALALYQQASSQTTPPSSHSGTFRNCGKDTTTGASEVAQIPSDWK